MAPSFCAAIYVFRGETSVNTTDIEGVICVFLDKERVCRRF